MKIRLHPNCQPPQLVGMIKRIVILFIWLTPFLPYGQSSNFEHQYQIWQDSTKTIRERLDAFYEITSIDINQRPQFEEIRLIGEGIDQAIEWATKEDLGLYLSRFMTFKSMSNFSSETSCDLADKAYQVALNNNDVRSVILNCSIFIYDNCFPNNHFNNREELLEYLNQLDKKITNNKDLITLQMLYGLLGNYFYSKEKYPEALYYLRKSLLTTHDSGAPSPGNIYSLYTIGNIHSDIENFKDAESYYFQSLQGAKMANDTLGLGANYTSMANMRMQQKQPAEALRYIDSAVAVMKPITDNDACVSCLYYAKNIQAGILSNQKRFAEALKLLKGLQTYYDSDSESRINYSHFYHQMAVAEFGLKNYRAAILAAQKGLAHKNYPSITFLDSKNNYEVLYQSYEKLGNTVKAYEAYKNFVKVNDSMASLRNSQEVTRLELENNFQQERYADSLEVVKQNLKRELEFQEKIHQGKTSRNILLGLGLIAVIIAIGLFSKLRFSRKTQKILEEKNHQIETEKEKALASEKAKHQFLANMSHEIRTPMNAIKGMTDILLRRKPKKEQLEYLNGIKESSDSLLVIINDILDISKIEAGKIELEKIPFSVEQVLSNVDTIMKFKAEEKGLKLKSAMPKALPTVIGDPSRLRQILVNLISNAIKFTEKGTVTTSANIEPHPDSRYITLHFTVSDTGIGIAPERFDKIFESFEQAYADTSRKFGGTGLGLSISKKLVELHKGRIWVESRKGAGSDFHFTCAYLVGEEIHGEATHPRVREQEKMIQHLIGIKILLVEDNTFNAIVAQEELEDGIPEVTVDVAENGAIAIQKINETDYDIVLMDVQMPIMNGYETTKAIREMPDEKSHLPIIAMTANVLKEEIAQCYEAGMNDFIGKPFHTPDLLEKIFNLKK